MSYEIFFTQTAIDDAKAYEKGGDKAILKKIKALLVELQEHPTTGTGKPEPLKYNLSGKWSRRINQMDRMVYSIDEENKIVTVTHLKSHYQF